MCVCVSVGPELRNGISLRFKEAGVCGGGWGGPVSATGNLYHALTHTSRPIEATCPFLIIPWCSYSQFYHIYFLSRPKPWGGTVGSRNFNTRARNLSRKVATWWEKPEIPALGFFQTRDSAPPRMSRENPMGISPLDPKETGTEKAKTYTHGKWQTWLHCAIKGDF